MMSLLSPERAGCMTVSEVVEATKADVENGLNFEEITQRRSFHGFNEFEITKEEPLWKKYLGEVKILKICSDERVLIFNNGNQLSFLSSLVFTLDFLSSHRQSKDF